MVELGSVVFGKWRIVGHLGAGGMGDVWRVEAVDSPLTAALKTIRADAIDDDGRARFVREAKLMSAVVSEHVVALHEVGLLTDGSPCFVMDLVMGESLEHRLERLHALPWQTAVSHVRHALAGLAAAHERGIVHRDVKPANILIEMAPPHRARIADFGIARLADESVTRLTALGVVTGTLDYMSPEQLQDGHLDGRADVYSAGLALFRALEGQLPFPQLGGVPRALKRCVTDIPACQAPVGFEPLPVNLVHALASMLSRAAAARPTAAEAVELLDLRSLERGAKGNGTQRYAPAVPPAAPAAVAATPPATPPAAPAGAQAQAQAQPPAAAPAAAPAAVASTGERVAAEDRGARCLLVVRAPPARLAMTSERRALAEIAAPSRAFTLGAFWFVVLDEHRRSTVVAAIRERFGAFAAVHFEDVGADFAISAAAALGAAPLPPEVHRAFERLATS